MNKLKKFFLAFLPIVMMMSYSVPVRASLIPSTSTVPVIPQQVLVYVEQAISYLHTAGLASNGVYPTDNRSLGNVIANYIGVDPALTADDYTVRPLNSIEMEDLSSNGITYFYDQNGLQISVNDLYLVNGNNSFYNTTFYMDSEGNILFSDPNHENMLLSVGLNDSPFSTIPSLYNNWDEVYSSLSSRIEDQNFNYYPTDDQENFTNNTFFYWYGLTNSQNVPYCAGYFYIPNQYISGTIVPLDSHGKVKSWYTNDPNLIQFYTTLGAFSRPQLSVTQGNYSYKNHTYSYLVSLATTTPLSGHEIGYGDFLSENFIPDNNHAYYFDANGVIYGDAKDSNSNVFVRSRVPDVDYITSGEMYDYSSLQQVQPVSQPELNPAFDPAQQINAQNYPVIYPMPTGIINPGTNPLPGVDPLVNPFPQPAPNPVIEVDPESPLGSNVPFINNLMNRFPFSIPWDVARFVSGFSVIPTPPAWDFDYSITVWGHTYTTHFQGDLSAFNSLAELFRTLELTAFVIFLAFLSYKYFF